jgi:hypothetical protein
MVVIKCRIIAKPQEGTRPTTEKEMMKRAAIYLDPLYEESLAGDLSTFVVVVLTSLRIMFLERK